MVGWCDGADKLPVPGRHTYLDHGRARATALAVGGGCLDIYQSSVISLFLLPLFGRRLDID